MSRQYAIFRAPPICIEFDDRQENTLVTSAAFKTDLIYLVEDRCCGWMRSSPDVPGGGKCFVSSAKRPLAALDVIKIIDEDSDYSGVKS